MKKLDHIPELVNVVKTAYLNVQARAHEVTYDILRSAANWSTLKTVFDKALRAMVEKDKAGSARFLRYMYKRWPKNLDDDEVVATHQSLEELLSSNLTLACLAPDGQDIKAGAGDFSKGFLRASIEDEDLPWDAAVKDW